MGQQYFQPVKKFISRRGALEKLNLTNKQFDHLCVLTSVYPVIADERNCIDVCPGFYFTINDIKRMFYSEAYNTIRINAGRERKREEFLKFKQFERSNRVKTEEMSLIPLVKSRYSCFGESLCDIGNSLRGLYFIRLFKIAAVDSVLKEFEDFVLENRFLKSAFLSKKGVYYRMDLEGKIIMWMVPYPGNSLEDLIEEKEQIEKKNRFIGHFEFDSSDETEFIEEEIVESNNDPNKQDLSLLKYSSPLFEIHVKLVLHKLRLLYKDSIKKTGIFSKKKVFIKTKSIKSEIEFILKNEEAELVSIEEAEIFIGEEVDEIRNDCLYLQPQYVFDSLNSSVLLDPQLYAIGKPLPIHKSPFPDVLETISPKILKSLSNRKRNMILDKVEELE